jgi:ATP-dependent DNA helicase 2 subunit 2
MLLLDKIPNKKRKVSDKQSQAQYTSQTQIKTPPKSPQKMRKKKNLDDSETERESETELESDQELLLQAKKPQRTTRTARPPTPASRESSVPREEDDRLPGRIIGMAYPLEDFKKNIASGDLVTKAVEDLAFVIQEVVKQPFSSRRTPEMLECMKYLRKVATEVKPYSVLELEL